MPGTNVLLYSELVNYGFKKIYASGLGVSVIQPFILVTYEETKQADVFVLSVFYLSQIPGPPHKH
jgi:hypothetical protein